MAPLLEVEHLKKYFRAGGDRQLHAVDDISFTLEAGKTLGVVGESGCGKTTLGRTIVHLIEPTEGTIRFEGEDISNPSKKDLRRLRQGLLRRPLFLSGVRRPYGLQHAPLRHLLYGGHRDRLCRLWGEGPGIADILKEKRRILLWHSLISWGKLRKM